MIKYLPIKLTYLLVIAIAFVQTAHAEEKTVTLHAPTMNCPVCPITVGKALKSIDGVLAVESDFESKTFSVAFDDQKTTIDTLTETTSNAGYPSSVITKNDGK